MCQIRVLLTSTTRDFLGGGTAASGANSERFLYFCWIQDGLWETSDFFPLNYSWILIPCWFIVSWFISLVFGLRVSKSDLFCTSIVYGFHRRSPWVIFIGMRWFSLFFVWFWRFVLVCVHTWNSVFGVRIKNQADWLIVIKYSVHPCFQSIFFITSYFHVAVVWLCALCGSSSVGLFFFFHSPSMPGIHKVWEECRLSHEQASCHRGQRPTHGDGESRICMYTAQTTDVNFHSPLIAYPRAPTSEQSEMYTI